jgi:hypothetical protein
LRPGSHRFWVLCRHLWLVPVLVGLALVAGEVAPVPSAAQRSEEIREAIRASLPKYASQPAGDSSQAAGSSGRDEERNGVLHLPTMTVRSKKGLSSLGDYQMMTPKGRLEMARKLYPALKLGNLLGLNNAIATGMLREEVEASRKTDLQERIRRATIVETPETRETDELLKAATARPDMHWAGQGRP